MTEKEKAKAYDEALERAKKLHDKIDIKEIFPEHNQSEDERIRKEIISILRNAYWTSNKNRFNELVAWLERQGKEEHGLKSFKDEDVCKFMQYIEKQAKAYEFNLPNRSYDIYAFTKDLLVWLEKQSEQESSQINERVWLYLISDVLTWKDGIGQYLDDPRVQELAKKLCKEYAQKLYNSSNTGKNEQKFKVGDWIITPTNKVLRITSIEGISYRFNNESHYWPICYCDEECRLWTIEDAKDGDVLACNEEILLFKAYSVQGRISLYCWYNGQTNNFHDKEVIDTLLTKRNEICPATQKQCDLLFQKIKEAGYKWDTEKKELKKEKSKIKTIK